MQSDDEEAAAEEEAEALRLQREQAAQLAPEDFDDAHLFPSAAADAAGGGSSDGDGGGDGEDVTMGAAAAAQVRGTALPTGLCILKSGLTYMHTIPS